MAIESDTQGHIPFRILYPTFALLLFLAAAALV